MGPERAGAGRLGHGGPEYAGATAGRVERAGRATRLGNARGVRAESCAGRAASTGGLGRCAGSHAAARLGYDSGAGRAATGAFRHAGAAARLDGSRTGPAARSMGSATLALAFTSAEPARRLGHGYPGGAEHGSALGCRVGGERLECLGAVNFPTWLGTGSGANGAASAASTAGANRIWWLWPVVGYGRHG